MSKFFKRKDSKPPNKIRFAALHFHRKFDNFEYLYIGSLAGEEKKIAISPISYLVACGLKASISDFTMKPKFFSSQIFEFLIWAYILKTSGNILQTFEF